MGEVDAGHLVEIEAKVKVGLIAYGLVTLTFAVLEGFLDDVNLGLEGGVHGLDLGITVLDFLGVEVVEFQGLLESEEVFGTVVAFEGQGDLFFGFTTLYLSVQDRCSGSRGTGPVFGGRGCLRRCRG